MRIRSIFYALVLFSAAVVSFCASAQAESPNGTTIPSATEIVDASGNVWTMPSLTSPGNVIYKNGNPTTGDGSHVLLLYYNGVVYAANAGNFWFQFTDSGWTQLASGVPNPSPSATAIPAAPSIVDASGNVWTMPSLTSPGNVIYKNGNPTTGDGSHVLLLYYNGTVYAANTGNSWYQFTSSGWTQLASGVPNPSPSGTTIPSATAAIVDGSGNVWTMPSLTSPGNIIYKNGNPSTGDGAHVLAFYYNGSMYAENTGDAWYQMTGTGWTPITGPPTTSTGPDPTGSVLPSYNDAYANWKNAGLLSVGGIPTRTTICATLSPSGVTPPAGNDDANNIRNAIASCPSGGVVMLTAGTFNISMSETIVLGNSVTLRGSGTCNNSSSPYCSTVINVYDGLLSWTGGACGTSTSTEVACVSNPAIQVQPAAAANQFDLGWSACSLLSVASTSCGAIALAADASPGQTTIQVSSTSSFSVGMWVLIDEASGAGWQNDPVGPNLYDGVWAAPDWLSTSGSPATGRVQWALFGNADGDFSPGQNPSTPGTAGCWQSFCDRPTAEIHLVTSIGAGPCPGPNCTLTFDDPLTVAFRQRYGQNAQVYFPAHQNGTPMAFLQYAGVENLTIARPTNGGINFLFCAYCWTKNVEVVGWAGGGVNFDYSVRSQMDTTFVNNCGNSVNNGAEYPIGIQDAATEIYVVNSITLGCGKGMVGKTGAGSVVAYNYMDDTMYDSYSGIGDYWVDMGINGSHYAGTHHMLFEGNWGDNLDNDDTHGNAMYHTYFRNWGTGLRTSFIDPSINKRVNDAAGVAYACGTTGPSSCFLNPPGPLRAAGPMMHDYWFAYVGNVLGTAGVSTVANGWTYQGSFAVNPAIWMLGWNSDANNATKSDPNLTASSGAFIFRHGDYDYVNGSIADWTAGYSQTLPDSFHLSSSPAFFGAGASCTYPWPWVTPTGSSPIQTNSCGGDALPAKARYNAGTPFRQP